MWVSCGFFFSFLSCIVTAQQDEECTIYLAESSKSSLDDFKWGLYAGTDISPNSLVTVPDVAIPIVQMTGNARSSKANDEEDEEEEEGSSLEEKVIDFMEQFIWVPDSSGGKFEGTKEERIVTAIPGVGALGGYDSELTNAMWRHEAAYFRQALGEAPPGVAHAGRGASSIFFNATMTAKHVIPKGMEVFVDYGENYETDNDDDESEKDELERDDFDKIDQVINRIVQFYDEFEAEMTEEGKKDIYEFLMVDIMGAVAGAKKGKKIQELLPDTVEELREVKAKGGSYFFNKPGTIRDVAWLEEHGMCMDNLEMGASTIPHAGRGAFAKRDMAKGHLVAPVPLIHMPSKKIMDMHELAGTDDQDTVHRASDHVIGQQLMLNYCFGHPQSSLLLFPTASGVSLINHSSKKPNAKIVWSSSKHHRGEWLKLPLLDLLEEENQFLGLMFDVVATRNIQKGEEVLLDYGKDWEKAWKEHSKSFSTSKDWPLHALDLNQEFKTKAFRTPEELQKEPYVENVRLMGFLVVQSIDDEANHHHHQEEGSKGRKRKWTTPKKGTVFDTEHLYDCRVTGRKEVNDKDSVVPYKYTVVWKEGTDDETIVTDVPHYALVFVDKPGTSDHFVPDAFRHAIGIPDDVFPQGPWRDLA